MDVKELADRIAEAIAAKGITATIEQTSDFTVTTYEDRPSDTPLRVWQDLNMLRIRLQDLRDPSLTGGIDFDTRPVRLAIEKVEEALHWLGHNEPPWDIPAPAPR